MDIPELTDAEIEEQAIQRMNEACHPEQRKYTPSEEASLRTAVHEAASRDIRSAYSLIRRLRDALIVNEEFTKVAFLRDLRIEILTGEAS